MLRIFFIVVVLKCLKFANMPVYYTVREYIQSRESLEAKITAIESLIEASLLESVDFVGDSGTAEYSLDDGQMKVTTRYRSMKEVFSGVDALEKLLQRYVNRLNGSVTVLRGRLNY